MEREVWEVIQSHTEAVISGNPMAMAADYANDAVLIRPEAQFKGRKEIEAYFSTVPERLGEGVVVFDKVDVDGQLVKFWWHLEGGSVDGVSGCDECEVRDGLIVSQKVFLNESDF